MTNSSKTSIALKAALAVTVGSLLGINAHAATAGQNYVGVKVGQVMVDDDGVADNLKDATAFAIYGGHQFTPNIGIEAEYIGSKDADVKVEGIDAEYNVNSLGLYGTYTQQFQSSPLFVKGKLGVTRSELEVSALGQKASTKETDIALGAALGYQLNSQFDAQAEYMYVTGDSDTGVWTVGLNYKF